MASGDTLLTLHPHDSEYRASDAATPDVITATTGERPVLDYDGSTDETGIWTCVMPTTYSDGGITVVAWAAMDGGNGANVALEVAVERVPDGGNLASGGLDFTTVNTSGAVTPAATGVLFDLTTTFTSGADMGNITAGDLFRFKAVRDTGIASNADDLQLVAIEIRET